MEKTLEQVKIAVAALDKKGKNNLKPTRTLLLAIGACQKFIKENSQTDRGCAQRMVRELDELLNGLPIVEAVTTDKDALSRLHTKRLAEEHLELLHKHLSEIVRVLENDKQLSIHQWANEHPVFAELKQLSLQRLGTEAYVLLFCQKKDDTLEIVTKSNRTGQIFTRFGLLDFCNAIKLRKTFSNKPPVVGAAVIKAQELITVIGKVPQPIDNESELQVLLYLSKQAINKPAEQYLGANSVLQKLHELSTSHQIPKDAYILLFAEDTKSTDTQDLELVCRTKSIDKITTRFFAVDFAVKRKLFAAFSTQPTVVGAAIIKHNKLALAIGQIPSAAEGQSELDVLLAQSRASVEKPYLDFVENNAIFSGLRKLANTNTQRDAEVIFFTCSDNGNLEVVSPQPNTNKPHHQILLTDFQEAEKINAHIHD